MDISLDASLQRYLSKAINSYIWLYKAIYSYQRIEIYVLLYTVCVYAQVSPVTKSPHCSKRALQLTGRAIRPSHTHTHTHIHTFIHTPPGPVLNLDCTFHRTTVVIGPFIEGRAASEDLARSLNIFQLPINVLMLYVLIRLASEHLKKNCNPLHTAQRFENCISKLARPSLTAS